MIGLTINITKRNGVGQMTRNHSNNSRKFEELVIFLENENLACINHFVYPLLAVNIINLKN